jgi:hypothetical protein
MDILIRNMWGNKDELLKVVKEAIRIKKEHGQEREIGNNQFKREIIGQAQMTRDEYNLACKAINIAINKVKQMENEKEKPQKHKKDASWMSQSANRQQMRDHGTTKVNTRISREEAQLNEKILREDHSHYDDTK